jgi:hypothetical protein
MNIVAVLNDGEHIVDVITSLRTGLMAPSQILVVGRGQNKELPGVEYIVAEGVFDARVLETIGDDAYILLLENDCTYPPHLISEYNATVGEIKKDLDQKLPNNKGSVYGLCGVIMTPDKAKILEHEFKELVGEHEEGFESRCGIGYLRENATVDFLELTGSILIHRSLIGADFMDYMADVRSKASAGVDKDIVLSNYFAKHGILRTQICNLAINRFMLLRGGYMRMHKALSDEEKQRKYVATVSELRSRGVFYAYI